MAADRSPPAPCMQRINSSIIRGLCLLVSSWRGAHQRAGGVDAKQQHVAPCGVSLLLLPNLFYLRSAHMGPAL